MQLDRFMVTAYGHEVNLAHPLPGQIDIGTIAHALAQVNRFAGHAARPYSVAEHSLLVCELAEVELGLDVHGQFAALMHDAHEAFCGDMPSPAKPLVEGWASWEQHWEHLVRRCFALNVSTTVHRAAIKRADLLALATERKALLNTAATTPWGCLAGIEPVGWVDLHADWRLKASWQTWRDLFRDKHDELDFARNDAIRTRGTTA